MASAKGKAPAKKTKAPAPAPDGTAAIAEGRLPIGVPSFIQAWHRDFDYLYIVGPRVPNPMPALLEELDSASQFVLYKIRKPKP